MAVNRDEVYRAVLKLLNDTGEWAGYVAAMLEDDEFSSPLIKNSSSVDEVAKILAYATEWERKMARAR